MPLTLIEPPASLPVSLAEAKAFLRIEHAEDDALIENLIGAAVEHVEQATGRQFMPAEFMLTARCFDPIVRLPRSPVLTVESVQYRDRAGNLQTLVENVDYLVDIAAEPATVEPVKSWPTVGDYPDAAQIAFTAGYAGDGGSPEVFPIPQRARVAIKALTAHWYEERAPVPDTPRVTEAPYHVTRLINGLRVWR